MKKRIIIAFMALCTAFASVPAMAADTNGTAQETRKENRNGKEEYSDVSVLTGEPITPELASQRPIAVMYPIDKAAQPQYGLSNVDIFYEMPEEGNMSRQMGILQDWQNLERIGNIRSIRSYFVYEALEWDPIIIHYGGPIDYTIDILTRKDVDNLNGVGGPLGGDYGCYYRIPAGSRSEHTAYTDAAHIKSAMEKAGFSAEHRKKYYNKKHFLFAAKANKLTQYADSMPAEVVDMSGCFPVTKSALKYNEKDGKYDKTLYGKAQCDAATGEQMTFDNILIQRASWEPRAEGSSYLRVFVESDGKDGFYITKGRMIHVTWAKGEGNDYKPTVFYDDKGKEIRLNKGKTMIFVVKDTDSFSVDGLTYEPDDHHTLTPEYVTEKEARLAEEFDEDEVTEDYSQEE